MSDSNQKYEKVHLQLDLTDKDWEELNSRWDFHEWHWNMYTYMNGSLINGISVIELKINDFIADYFTFCDKTKSRQFIEYIMAGMTLSKKYQLLNQLLIHIDIKELGEINDKDYSLLEDFEKIIRYRNMFAHSVLDQNYNKLKQLKERQRIRLQYLSGKKQSTRFVSIVEHREIMDKLCEINRMLIDIVIDTNRSKFPDIYLDHNRIDKSQYEPKIDEEE